MLDHWLTAGMLPGMGGLIWGKGMPGRGCCGNIRPGRCARRTTHGARWQVGKQKEMQAYAACVPGSEALADVGHRTAGSPT